MKGRSRGSRRRGIARWALRSIPLMLVLPVAACEARPSWEREGLGRAYFDPSGAFVHAGVSARARPAVVPLAAGAFGADTLGRDFHLFRTRCGACHETPDPGMKTPEHWSFLIGRMKEKTGTAGLIPMTPAEADSILGLLMRHGKR